MKPFEIFKAGTHTPGNTGKALSFSDGDLAAAAAAYDPALSEAPIVIGHPASNLPAWGWIKSLSFSDGRLVAEPHEVNADFAEMVEQKLFKKRSASFYPPEHPSNPTPGGWYLRHVGFLGAQPPSVKGLKDVAFADDDGVVTVEFGEGERIIGWTIRSLADMARRLRDVIIARDGLEEADKLLPNYAIDNLIDNASRLSVINERGAHNFSEEDDVTDKTKAELEAQQRELEAQKAAQEKQAAEFAERERKFERAENERELKALADAGKLAPGAIPGMLDFMDGLDRAEIVEFGEGDGSMLKTRRDFFLDLLKQGGKLVDFSERSAPENTIGVVNFAAPDGAEVDAARLEQHSKAVEWQRTHPNATYAEALHAVGVN